MSTRNRLCSNHIDRHERGWNLTSESTVLTGNSSIGSWLDHPVGGDLVRGLLAQSGATEEMLAPLIGCRCSSLSR